MKTIKYNNKTKEVVTLCELLNAQGYQLIVSDSFTLLVDKAVKDFQLKNNLISDGIVGLKTWSKLYELQPIIINNNDKFLSEQDLIDFSNQFQIELAAIKAINHVESGGKGFLLNGLPSILFEGHVFWKQLENNGIDPNTLIDGNEDILYKYWTKKYYVGGAGEHERLQKAIRISASKTSPEAALASASWGCFQIMGYHAINLGYLSITDFTQKMHQSEREHLFALGRFIKTHHANLPKLIEDKNWDRFAFYYNGSGYKKNKYDEKLAAAYKKYSQ